MYLLSVLAVILGFVLVQMGQSAIGAYQFLDAMSLLSLLVLIIPIMLSAGLLQDLNNAFRFVFGKKKEGMLLEIKRAKLAVDTVRKVAIYSSVFIMTLQFVVFLHSMLDPAHLGPIISTIFLTLLYAIVVCLLLLPIGAKLEQRILEYIPSCPEKKEEQQEVNEETDSITMKSKVE